MRQKNARYSFFCHFVIQVLPYTVVMKRYFLTHAPYTALLSNATAVGFWAIVALFAVCFFLVHVLRWALAFVLQRFAKKQPPPEEPPKAQEKPTTREKQPEKIYYIVERKKKRESAKYAEPKEFRFK